MYTKKMRKPKSIKSAHTLKYVMHQNSSNRIPRNQLPLLPTGVTSETFSFPMDRKISNKANISNKDQSQKHICNRWMSVWVATILSTFYVQHNKIESII